MTGNFEGDIIMNQADKDAIAHQVGMTAANKVSFDMGESGTGIGKEVAEAYNTARKVVLDAVDVTAVPTAQTPGKRAP